MSDQQAQELLIVTIERVFVDAVKSVGVNKVTAAESFWPCWKGVVAVFSPVTHISGVVDIFEAAAEGHGVIYVVLYIALDRNHAKLIVDPERCAG